MELTKTRSAPGKGFSHRPHLDGLRTVAIYLVVLFHAGLTRFEGGFIGVDVFFVLSGFLVGSVIVHEYEATGRVDLVKFYARRVRRLLPAAVVTVVGVSAMSVVVEPRLARDGFVDDAQSALLYFANWHFLSDATNYFATDVDKSPFLHFWSLAIEEQFYVVFPLLLVGLFVLAKRLDRPAVVPAGLGVALVASLTAQLALAQHDPLRAYYGTDTRFYQLLAGTTLAVLVRQTTLARQLSNRRGWAGAHRMASSSAVLALAATVFVATDAFDGSTAWRGVAATVCTVALIVACEVAPTGLLGRFLASAPMTYLGRISYGTYLWHWPLIVLAVPVLDLGPWQRAAWSGIGGTALAALSFALIESPIRTSKFVLRRPGTVIVCGLTLSLIAAIVLVPPILHS
ncbi:MAG: acyltransferase, partial [Ilumatobacteraceae bacterium]|nr:acyltransferase [Ilumatobacteraceae bacterium]